MKLAKVGLKNFRCYREYFEISFTDLTAIIAKNDVGKSAILEALDVFFDNSKIDSDDKNTNAPSRECVEITCFFENIPEDIVIDSDKIISPYNEYLLNRDNQLVVKKKYKGATLKLDDVVVRSLHPTAENYNDLFTLKIGELRTRAQSLGVSLENVNSTVKSCIRHAIWEVEDINSLEIEEVEISCIESVWKSLEVTLPTFQLFKSDRPSSDQDAEAQDPLKSAVKEALQTVQEKLEEVKEYVQNHVETVTDLTIEKLKEMDPDLASVLNPKFDKTNWEKIFKISLTNENDIPLNKRGSGVRRLFLINFFRAKAELISRSRESSSVIYAIEEPETAQHPNNQIMLLEALRDLSSDEYNQVIMTTHHPLLASRLDISCLRYIGKNEGGNREVLEMSNDSLQEIKKSLGVIVGHNVKVFIGVEGPNDIEFLTRLSVRLNLEDPDIPNLRALEEDGEIIFVPLGGSTLHLWSARLEELDIPEVHIYDRDYQPPLEAHYQEEADDVNLRNGCVAFITTKRETENYIHHSAINDEYGLDLSRFDDFDDVPAIVARAVHDASESPNNWDDLTEQKKHSKKSYAKKRLNRNAVDQMTRAMLDEVDSSGDVISWLNQIKSYLD